MQLNPQTTCLRPPCHPILPFTETVPYQSSLLLLHVATCPRASPAGRDATTPTALHGSTPCLPGQRANVQRQDDMAICSYPTYPRSREILYHFIRGVTEDFCHFARRVSVCVCVIHDILTLYQHNWGSCQVGPWITFHWCAWPNWSTASHAYWPKRAPYSGETLWLSGCHVTSGTSRAEKKGRVSQIHHVPYTQAVLTLARPSHQWQYLFVFTPVNATKPFQLVYCLVTEFFNLVWTVIWIVNLILSYYRHGKR